MKVLLVDDDPNLLKVLSDILRAKGLEAIPAETGDEALAQVDSQEIDVALIDLKLEGVSGLEVLRDIKARSAATECILLTGFASQASAIEAVNLGAFAYYQKPYSIDQLLLAIRRAGERRTMETALRDSEERFRTWLENALDLITVVGFDGTIQYASPSYTPLLGYMPGELIGTNAFDLVHPDDVDRILEIFAHNIQVPDSEASAEFRMRHADGSWCMIEALGKAYTDAQGQTLGLLNGRDITERKQASETLRQRMAELEALHAVSITLRTVQTVNEVLPIVLNAALTALETEAGSMRLYNPDTNMLEASVTSGWFRQLSRAPMKPTEGIAGRVFSTQQTHLSADFWQDPFTLNQARDVVPPGWGGACVPIHTDVMVIGVLFVSVPYPRVISPEQASLLESLAELTGITIQRMRFHAQTQAQAQRTQQIIDSAPEGMLVLDTEMRLVQANPTALAYLPDLGDLKLGEEVGVLGGQPVTDFLHTVDPSQPWHELSGGEPLRIFELAAQPLGSQEQPTGWVLILRDVTADRERQRYQQAQDNLATVGQMAAGIAHDFNNILGAIILYTTLLHNSPGLSAKQLGYVGTIEDQSHHAANLVRQILDFGRRSIMEQAAVDMLPLVKESIKLMGRTLPEHVRLHLTYDRDEYVIFGDPTRLQQMLINLAFNARDAMPAGGDLTLQLSTIAVSSGQPAPLPDMGPGVWVRLDVADTGSGVEPRHLPHLFQPFFTTKGVGKGTGLGLAQVYGIVKQHDGAIGVESQVGQGTAFSIYLPLYRDAVIEPKPRPAGENVVGGGETVLLVEDNDVIRQAVGDSLEELGYQVFSALDGAQALSILAEQAKSISLLLSDMVMPKMGGLELAEIVGDRYPGLKILIMSGHPLNMGDDAMTQAGILGWIEKPFVIDELAEQVRSILDKPA